MSPASRKDFILIAGVIREYPLTLADREELALTMGRVLKDAYPGFDMARFFEAATGLDYGTREPLVLRNPSRT